MAIEIQVFEDELEFLKCLENKNLEEWGELSFRGQPDASYELVPSVWRDDVLFHYFLKRIDEVQYKKQIHDLLHQQYPHVLGQAKQFTSIELIIELVIKISYENFLLSNFYHSAKRRGLLIPEHEFEYCEKYPPTYWLKPWAGPSNGKDIINELFSVYTQYKQQDDFLALNCIFYEMSLPQHYGIPTRLLDWTNNPRIAAFFAGYAYLNLPDAEKEKVKELAVYILKIKDTPSSLIKIYDSYNRYINKYANAQEALFTTFQGEFYYLDRGQWPSIEELCQYTDSIELQKITLCVQSVKPLLNRLDKSGISISKLMPDYKHVAEQVVKYMALN